MSLRVLVVDDSKTTRDMVSFTLRNGDYNVLLAEDGEKALALLEGAPVDCIVTDLNMPAMDGLDLIRTVRSRAVSRLTPILMLTTEADVAKKDAGRLAGATAWLNKPFHPKKLLDVVGRIVAPA